MKQFLHFGFLLLLVTVFVPAQMKQHPATYIDKGACPFECCTYRRWKTQKDTVAYALPDKRSKRVGTYHKGSWVRGLTGEVHTITPGKFVVRRDHDRYQYQDVLWVYTPLGEGFYKIWYKGRMRQESLNFMSGLADDNSPSCVETPDCWVEVEVPLKTVWWAKVRSSAGWIGWTDQTGNFGNMDACG